MSAIGPKDMEHYRKLVAAIDLPDEQKDECIRTVFNIVSSFVDQAFGLHPVQLSLKERANPCFSRQSNGAMIAHDLETETVDLEDEGAINTQDA